MTVKKFWHRGMESELISRTSHCQTRTPPGTWTAAVSSKKESDMYLLVFVDTLSGWTEAFPTKHETAQTITKKLLEDILPRYGFPVRIGSHNRPGFVSKCRGNVQSRGSQSVFGAVGLPLLGQE
ncbi:unnamed protein product [Nyctereutes procyonoides]|uniref:(raccoon dog) hypothetical protein n=1 Tax=Nyctereutes procyonoides TaxID=34880 RepID=A0A811ZWP1_NYCPR|nr:unnamed protein product [Nyctereutes procyonoides]